MLTMWSRLGLWKHPECPYQADYGLDVVWRHTNHTKFCTWSYYGQLGTHVRSRLWSALNSTPVWLRIWLSHEKSRLLLACYHEKTVLWPSYGPNYGCKQNVTKTKLSDLVMSWSWSLKLNITTSLYWVLEALHLWVLWPQVTGSTKTWSPMRPRCMYQKIQRKTRNVPKTLEK